MAVGDVNRADGLPDWVVAVRTSAGAALLVFESPSGAARAEPETINIDAPATDLRIVRFDDKGFVDVVAAAGTKLIVVRGRDRRLTDRTEVANAIPLATVEIEELAYEIRSLEIGDFLWEPSHTMEVALLGSDQQLHFLGRADAAASESDRGASQARSWVHSRDLPLPGRAGRLIRSRTSALPVDGLIALEPGASHLSILTGDAELWSRANFEKTVAAADSLSPIRFDLESEVVEVLPMQLNGDALEDLIVLGGAPGSVPFSMPTVPAATFTVTNTNDSGSGSLRQAILNANGAAGADYIAFAISGSGIPTISPLSALPKITGVVTIDGSSQTAGLVAINGTSAGAGVNGLDVAGGSSGVIGIVMERFGNYGVFLETNGSNQVYDCRIGTTTAGTAAAANGGGISMQASSPNNTIGGLGSGYRNLISGNSNDGIDIISGGNIVEGNYIGTNLAGNGSLPNGSDGILAFLGAGNTIGGTIALARNVFGTNADCIYLASNSSTLIQGNYIGVDFTGGIQLNGTGKGVEIASSVTSSTVGGTSAGARNVISGNSYGVYTAGGSGNLIQGNYIGTNAAGSVAVSTFGLLDGVYVGATGAPLIGGAVAGAGNVISGNPGNGIALDAGTATILGNIVGLDAGGTTAVWNRGAGIAMASSSNVVIGGTSASSRNVISGNGFASSYVGGIACGDGSTNVSIFGNYIGTNVAGTAAVPNYNSGISVVSTVNNIKIGSTTAGGGNVVSGNSGDGIYLSGILSGSVTVYGNIIGLNAAGTAVVANTDNGIQLYHASGWTIGGTAAGARNVISGNGDTFFNIGSNGILIAETSANNVVEGNYIGTDVTGNVALGNFRAGISIDCFNSFAAGGQNVIGGAGSAYRNVISGNQYGVKINGTYSSGSSNANQILGNYIGVGANGSTPLGNSYDGVYVLTSSSTEIGANSAGSGNVISESGHDGVELEGCTGGHIYGNNIGTDATGALDRGNVYAGVDVTGTSGGGTIVGVPSLGNTIAYNHTQGVTVRIGPTSVRGNSIHDNVGFGIDFGNGLVPNDGCSGGVCDSDTGPNGWQNFPVIVDESYSGSTYKASGTLVSTTNTTFTIDVYSNTGVDPSGYGEGRAWAGSTTATTDASGNATWIFVNGASSLSLPTVTATDPAGNTSEFSAFLNTSGPSEVASPPSLPLRASKGAGTIVTLSYTAACHATTHSVHWGSGPINGAVQWVGANCSMSTSFDPGAAPPSGLTYFVVAGDTAVREGSFGQDSAGVEIPAGAGCLIQLLHGVCP